MLNKLLPFYRKILCLLANVHGNVKARATYARCQCARPAGNVPVALDSNGTPLICQVYMETPSSSAILTPGWHINGCSFSLHHLVCEQPTSLFVHRASTVALPHQDVNTTTASTNSRPLQCVSPASVSVTAAVFAAVLIIPLSSSNNITWAATAGDDNGGRATCGNDGKDQDITLPHLYDLFTVKNSTLDCRGSSCSTRKYPSAGQHVQK
jgi:hypothetical protein